MADNDNKKPFWTSITSTKGIAVTGVAVATVGTLATVVGVLFTIWVNNNDSPPPTPIPDPRPAPSPPIEPSPTKVVVEPTATPPIRPSPVNPGILSECIDTPPDRIFEVEAGLNIPLIKAPQVTEELVNVAVILTDLKKQVGAFTFIPIISGQSIIFKEASVLDSACQPVNEYMPLEDSDTQDTLRNYATMCIQLQDSYYTLRLLWDEKPGTIVDADTRKLSSNSDPPSSDCESAIAARPQSP